MIRVELHNARQAHQYERLHQLLALHSIHNTIVADSGARSRLPPAEYYYVGTATRDEILAAAKMAAGAVDNSFAVVVSETKTVTWYGLKAA